MPKVFRRRHTTLPALPAAKSSSSHYLGYTVTAEAHVITSESAAVACLKHQKALTEVLISWSAQFLSLKMCTLFSPENAFVSLDDTQIWYALLKACNSACVSLGRGPKQPLGSAVCTRTTSYPQLYMSVKSTVWCTLLWAVSVMRFY